MGGEKETEQEEYVHQAYTELNPMTGLYYNRGFMKKASDFLKGAEPGNFSMMAVDIEHFRLFNKLYGRDSGDELIIYIADCIKKMQEKYQGIGGYFGGDNFCMILPDQMEIAEELRDMVSEGVRRWNNTVGFLPVIGIYPIEDMEVLPETMYDRARIALSHAVGNYLNRICVYDSGMEDKMEEEVKLLEEIQEGLEKEEFTFFAQPQCDISTGKIVGAESLVRWKHSTKGMIPPGVFIPVLEKNGMIADLDRYVWKMVCHWLRSWIDRGFHPVPISINISRIDIFSMDVPKYLMELLHMYDLPAKLLKTEVTESAYAESNDKINQTVKELRNAGFLVMMDDFGSGYSSLNMLKSVSVDVLKIDMRFLDINDKEEQKGIGILESVVNMARLMGLPIIVEGVETQKQEKFLLNMGCRYTQGYYYYKPLPIEQFEKLLTDERRLDFDGIWCKQVEPLHVREFLDDNMFSDTMLNNILGPVAFYEMYENRIEITRVNEQYFRLAGITSSQEADYNKKFWNHVRDDDRANLFSMFEQAYENPAGGAEGFVHYIRMDSRVLWVYLKVFFLREKDGHKMFYSSLLDMTSMRERKETKRLSEQGVIELTEEQQNRMEKYYGDIPCGFGIAKIMLDDDEKPYDYELVYANHEMEKVCGSDIKRFRYLALKAFGDNQQKLLQKAYQAAFLGETIHYYAYSSISSHYLELILYQYEYGYTACMLRDVTHMHIYEDALKSMMLSCREVYFLHLRDNYCCMIYPDENHMLERGNYEEVVNRHFGTGKILKYDQENVRKFLSLTNIIEKLETSDMMEYRYRRSAEGIEDEWCQTSITVSERENGIPKTAVMVIRSIDAIMKEEEKQRQHRMAETLANMSYGFFIYQAFGEEKLLYANPMVLRIFGCETMEEFWEFSKHSFRGMVHPEDLARITWEIQDQIAHSDKNMDYIQYRIVRKDGETRWMEDWGHLENSDWGVENKLFYVFIRDITDTMKEKEKDRLLRMSEVYNKKE